MSYSPLASGVPFLARSSARLSNNNTGASLLKGTPVRMSNDGASYIDVSDEIQANSVAGVVRTTLANGAAGEIITGGTIEDITTSYSVGAVVYVDKMGGLTDQKPALGVNSFGPLDWVIRIGVIGKNVNDPNKKDLLVNIQIVGQL